MKTRKMELNEISERIDPIVSMRNNNWFLVTAKDKAGNINGLTAAWGPFGNVCEKPTVTIYIRPQRYTKHFIDEAGCFTMTFFDFEQYQEALVYMGSRSGADDPEKIANAGLHVAEINQAPTYEEGKYVIVCKPFFVQQLNPENFTDEGIREKAYPNKDYSYMYIAEIQEAYEILM
jgi:Conserved protein/domain typically associated with flavoprotein oxygenases, DIM6/NTAB family